MEKGGGMLDYAAILFITFSNRDLNRTTISSCGPDNDVLKKFNAYDWPNVSFQKNSFLWFVFLFLYEYLKY